LWDRLKRLTSVVLIESSDHNTSAFISKALADVDEGSVKKLAFVDSDNEGVGFHECQYVLGLVNKLALNPLRAVRRHVIHAVPSIDGGFKHLNFLTCNLCTLNSPD
jgi:hypothetical protein